MAFSVCSSFSSDLNSVEDGPLSSDLARPEFFDVHRILANKQFLQDVVTLPVGLEHPTHFGSGRSEANAAVRAPFPCGSKITRSASPALGTAGAGGASSPRSPTSPHCSSPHNPNDEAHNLLRVQLGGFVTANGIAHLDARWQSHAKGSLLATSAVAELQDHIKTKAAVAAAAAAAQANAQLGMPTQPTQPTQSSQPIATGPHGSRKSRAVAVTLLLPSSIAGRTQGNSMDLLLLDAFALIAQASTARTTKNRDLADEVAKSWPSEILATTTTVVRMSTAAGATTVTEFLTATGVTTKGVEWLRSPSLCISFVDATGSAIDTKLANINNDGCKTLQQAVEAIQEAAAFIQVATNHLLTLPCGLIDRDALTNTIAERGDTATSAFLEFQAELQLRFQQLHLTPPFNECRDAVNRLDFKGGKTTDHHFVRVVKRGHFQECDRSHAIGILLSSHEPTLETYLRRCRREEPRQMGQNWPVYGLKHPESEEFYIDISVLYFKHELSCVGGDLSLFGPRNLIGTPLTEVANCVVNRVVPALTPVARLLDAGFWVCPVTRRSVLPAQGAFANFFHTVFQNFMGATLDRLAGQEVYSTLEVLPPEEPPLVATTLLDAETRAWMGHVLGLQVGHPATSLASIYEGLRMDSKEQSLSSSAFRVLVTAGLLRYGGDCNLEFLFHKCLEALEDAKTGEAAAAAASEEKADHAGDADDLAHLFANKEAQPKLLRLAKLAVDNPHVISLQSNDDADEATLETNTFSILRALWALREAGDFDAFVSSNTKYYKKVCKKRGKLVQNAEETWTLVLGTLLAVDCDTAFDIFCHDANGRVMRRVDRSATTLETPTIFDVAQTVPTSRLLAAPTSGAKPKLLVLVDDLCVSLIGPATAKKRKQR